MEPIQCRESAESESHHPASFERMNSRKSFHVPFHPSWRVRTQSILETTKPKLHELHIVLPRMEKDLIEKRKAELSFHWLDHLPCYGAEQRVYVGCFHVVPDSAHICWVRVRGILELASEHEEGFSVNDYLA